MSTKSLYIPVRDIANQYVRVPIVDLPNEVDDITDILVSEIAPAGIYLELANQYVNRGLIDQFKGILGSLTTEEALTVYQSNDQKAGIVDVLNELAGLEIWTGWKQPVNQSSSQSINQARVEHFQEAIQHINGATKLDFAQSMTWVIKGMLLIAQASANQSFNNQSVNLAERSFDSGINYDNDKRNSLAYVGKSICQFAKKQYREMLQSVNSAIFNNPTIPNACWFALGLAYLSIKDQTINQSMALKVFERMLSEDPTEVNALAGLALIKLNQAKDILLHHSTELIDASNSSIQQSINQLTEDALKLLSQAYSHNPYHPMTMLLLADHYFHQSFNQSSNQSVSQSDLQAVKMLCERGLEAVDASFHSIRCEFYYQLGRMHQSINQSTEAYEYYELAKKEAEIHDQEVNELAQANQKSTNQSRNKSADQARCRHPLVLLGHAQMCIATERWKDARADLEFLKSLNPSSTQVDQSINRLLGGVYMHFSLFEQAESLLKQAINQSPLDVELLVEYALCCEQIDRLKSQAKEMYQRAIQTIESLNQTTDDSESTTPAITPPAQLVHNLAVVCHELGSYTEAREYYERAIQLVEDQVKSTNASTSQSIHPATITSRYNLAVLNHHVALASHPSIDQVPAEELESIIAAYQSLIDSFPSYLDAHLRLGQLYLQFGKMAEALACFNAVISRNSRHLEARTLKAQWLSLNGSMREAEREYNQICMLTASGTVRVVDDPDRAAEEEEDEESLLKGDPYAKIALGNLYYSQGLVLARSMQPTQSLIKLKLTKSMAASGDPLQPAYWSGRAAGYYRSVLNSDPKSVYAAHGLGCILASQGEKTAAKEIFTAVREVAADCVESTINLANTLAQQQLYAPAVKLYEDSMSKLEQNASTAAGENAQDVKVAVLMSMAKTYYAASQLNDAITSNERALRLKPRESVLWYNRAILQEEYAIATLQKSVVERSLNEVQLAVDRLKDAIDTFTVLSSAGQKMVAARREYRAKKAAAGNAKVESTEMPDLSIDVSVTADSCHCPSAAAIDTRTCEFELDKRAGAHLDFCRSTYKSAVPHLEHAKKRAAEFADAAARAAQARQQEIENVQKAAEAEEAQRQAEREKAEEIARENQAKLASLHADWELSRKAEEQDDDMIDASIDGEEKGKKKKKTGKKKRVNQSDDDDNDESQNRRKRSKHSPSRSRSTSRTRDTNDQSIDQSTNQSNEQTDDGEESWQKMRDARQKKAKRSNDTESTGESINQSTNQSKRRGRLQRLNEDEEVDQTENDQSINQSTDQTDDKQASTRKRRTIADEEENEENDENDQNQSISQSNDENDNEQSNDANDGETEENVENDQPVNQSNDEQEDDTDNQSINQPDEEHVVTAETTGDEESSQPGPTMETD